MMGSTEDPDPKDAPAVAAAVFGAVAVYGVCNSSTLFGGYVELELLALQKCGLANFFLQAFVVFCGSQAFLHMRESRRGAISLS